MTTENPLLMISGGGAGGAGVEKLEDSAMPSAGRKLASSGAHEGVVQELDLLLRRHPRHETGRGRQDMLSYRSGSAPPSVAGSLAAIGSIVGDRTSTTERQVHIDNLSSAKGAEAFDSEHELLSDPAYLAYYYEHRHLNPRLPPPLISRSNYKFAHQFRGARDDRKLPSLDDRNNRSLFSSQLVLPTHREEPEFSEEEKSPIANLLRWASQDFQESGVETLTGFSARPKSLVDLIQEDFPRTPSPMYSQSRSSSRAGNENGTDSSSMLDIHITRLQDAPSAAVKMADSSIVISNSLSATPNPSSVQNREGSNGGHSSGSASSVLRTPSPVPLAGLPHSSIAVSIVDGIAKLNGGSTLNTSEVRSVSASSGSANSLRTSELAAAFESLSFNDVQEVPAHEEDGTLFSVHPSQQQLQHDFIDQNHSFDIHNQQYQQQRAQETQADMHVDYSLVSTQSPLQQQFLGHQVYGANMKYGSPALFNQPQNLDPQADATSSIYAAAAMSYMNAINPYYQDIQLASLFSPQYGISGYPLNPVMIPAMMAAFTAPGSVGSYESAALAAAAAVAAGMGGRVSPSGTLGGYGVDMQNLYKYTGQGSTSLQSHFQDPLYFHYLQQCLGEDACAAAALSDSALRGYAASGHLDTLELQKNQPSPMLGYSAEQKLHFSRSNSFGVPVGSKTGSVSPAYYGSPPGIGFVMPYPNSPISSPVLPGSPIVPGALPVRQADQNYHLSGNSWPSSGGNFGGWPSQRDNSTDDINGSSLLEELKNSKIQRIELSDIAGHVIEFSKDQHGSRFIQQKLETATSEEKDIVFHEVLPQALRLMTDVFGNYVVQKFFEHGSHEQRTDLANQLVGQVLNLSLQMYGCRVIQKALEVIDVDQQVKLVSELEGYIMQCVRDQNGNHVIQKCIECVPPDRINFIISAFYGQVVTLSTHPYGCRVIQRVLEHCTEKQKQNGVMDEIISATCTLAQDQYGNYVVQHVLEHGNQHEKSEIIKQLTGNFVQMSQHKFASNVVEKCIEFGGPAERQILVNEMLGASDENEPLQAMMKDQFGNYVVQKVLEACDDQQRERLLSRIKIHLHALKKYTYGKHIVVRVEKLIAAGEQHVVQMP